MGSLAKSGKVVWKATTIKKRKRGRPRKTWDKVIGKIMVRRGPTWSTNRYIPSQ